MDGQSESFQITGIEQEDTYCIDAIAATRESDPVVYLYDSQEFSVDPLVAYNDDREYGSSVNSRICVPLARESTYYLEVAELLERSGIVLLYIDREDAE